MRPEHWQEIENKFHEALSVPTEDRKQWLGTHCGNDSALYSAIQQLLDADKENASDDPFQGAVTEVVNNLDHLEAPTRLGSYRIEKEIGKGGMGSVYLAVRDDDQYCKKVAIKLLHQCSNLAEANARFHQERQILANLDHPYIAKLMDGGTSLDGRPYLILDYVEGVSISRHCTENLSVNGICRLFAKVCEAVAYAHQNLIVHRDLKPANILVTADGTPKLLDFGIAKLIGESDAATKALTRHAGGWLTPEYASPEQVKGTPITASSDVYSLGIILYELLTRKPAHRFVSDSPLELVRVVCEQEALPPSRDSKRKVSRDLDSIVLKALEKDPRRRYSSAEQLEKDLQRFLNKQPVVARNGNAGYRWGKLLQRHPVPAMAIMLAMGTLSMSAVQSFVRAEDARQQRIASFEERDRAELERVRAEEAAKSALAERNAAEAQATEASKHREVASKRFQQLRTLIQKILFEIDNAVENVPNATEARRVLVKTTQEYLDDLSKEKLTDKSLMYDLAVAYERVGDLQGNPAKQNLGDFSGALKSYNRALAIRKALASQDRKMANEMAALSRSIAAVQTRTAQQ